jgi:hypothetical protein
MRQNANACSSAGIWNISQIDGDFQRTTGVWAPVGKPGGGSPAQAASQDDESCQHQ